MHNFKGIFHWDECEDLDNFEMYTKCIALRDIGDDIHEDDEFEEVYFDKTKLALYFYKETGQQNPIIKKLGNCESHG